MKQAARGRILPAYTRSLIRAVLIVHCVLSFNHFMSSPLVQGGVDNFDNLRVVSFTDSRSWAEKKQAKIGTDARIGPLFTFLFTPPSLPVPVSAETVDPDEARASCMKRISSIRLLL